MRPSPSTWGALAAAFLISACGVLPSERGTPDQPGEGRPGAVPAMQRAAKMAPRIVALDAPAPGPAAAAATGSERLILRTASLDVEIDSSASWLSSVQALVEGAGGYVVSSAVHQARQDAKAGQLFLRVPQDRFDSVLAALRSAAVKVHGESQAGEDITEEFVDLGARLDNQQRTERRFREILRSAKTVEEILAVERELSRVREQIERLEGRRRFLEDRVRLSAITVDWHEPYPLGADEQGRSLWRRIADGFGRGIEGFAMVLEWLIAMAIALLPIAAFLAAAGWGVTRLRRWRRGRSLL